MTQELNDLNWKQDVITSKIKLAKRRANKELRQEHKTLLRVLDILFILMIVANIGALVLTNALVIREKPNVQPVELNPITAEQYGFVSAVELHPIEVVKTAIVGVYFHILGWFGMTIIWLWIRFFSVKRFNLYRGIMVIIFWGTALFLDFFNNLGLYIGKVIWG